MAARSATRSRVDHRSNGWGGSRYRLEVHLAGQRRVGWALAWLNAVSGADNEQRRHALLGQPASGEVRLGGGHQRGGTQVVDRELAQIRFGGGPLGDCDGPVGQQADVEELPCRADSHSASRPGTTLGWSRRPTYPARLRRVRGIRPALTGDRAPGVKFCAWATMDVSGGPFSPSEPELSSTGSPSFTATVNIVALACLIAPAPIPRARPCSRLSSCLAGRRPARPRCSTSPARSARTTQAGPRASAPAPA